MADFGDSAERRGGSRRSRAGQAALLVAMAVVGAMTLVAFLRSGDVTAQSPPAGPSSSGTAATPPSSAPSATSPPAPVESSAGGAPSIVPLTAGPGASAAAAYPPTTLADLQAFAATGNDADVAKFAFEQSGTARCLDPVVRASVAPSLQGQALAASAVAYFLSHGLASQPCKATLLLYYGTSADPGQAFTAGRVSLGQNADLQRFVKVEVGEASGATVLFTVALGPIAS